MIPDPQPGYRLLSGEEILQRGDEYYYPPLRQWSKTQCLGFTAATDGIMPLYYRRLATEPTHGRTAEYN